MSRLSQYINAKEEKLDERAQRERGSDDYRADDAGARQPKRALQA
jgi:hypothetical protein